ncbi:MAG: hypothetical protein ABEI06_09540 [Halobacteriaceae archaeon]
MENQRPMCDRCNQDAYFEIDHPDGPTMQLCGYHFGKERGYDNQARS